MLHTFLNARFSTSRTAALAASCLLLLFTTIQYKSTSMYPDGLSLEVLLLALALLGCCGAICQNMSLGQELPLPILGACYQTPHYHSVETATDVGLVLETMPQV